MANRLLNVLNEIEQGREACVKALKLKKIVTRKNASLGEIAAGIGHIEPDTQPISITEWVRPEEWPNLKEVMINICAEPDEDGYYLVPYWGFLLKVNNDKYTTFLPLMSSTNYFVTSGGHVVSGNSEYTFQNDDALDIGLDYKVQWIILCIKDKTKPTSENHINFSSAFNNSAQEALKYCCEVIWGHFYWTGISNWNFSVPNLQSIDFVDEITPPLTCYAGWAPDAYYARLPYLEGKVSSGGYRLNLYESARKIQIASLPYLTAIDTSRSFIGCPNLVEVLCPRLRIIKGRFLAGCAKLRYANLDNLEEVSFNIGTSYSDAWGETFANLGTSLYLPKLHTWYQDLVFGASSYNGSPVRGNVGLPALTLIRGNLNLQTVVEYLPSLKEIEGTLMISTEEHSYNNLPMLEKVNNIYVGFYNNHLIDDIDKFIEWLPTQTDGGEHKLTLQGTLVSQFTTEQLNIIIEKGWTIV